MGRPAAAKAGATVRAEASEDGSGPFLMPVILRADVSGSLEAIAHELTTMADEHKRIDIVQTGIGTVSENDVKTALAGNTPGVVLAFNVGIDPIAEALARERGIRIETFNIIYKLTERLQELLEASAPKRLTEEVVGRARILKTFSSRKDEHVIGAKVLEGYLARKASVRVIRRDAKIGMGKIKNIQSNKEDVGRIEEGKEFGAQIETDFELMQNDVLECVIQVMK